MRISRAGAAFASALATIVLIGWILDVEVLKRALPTFSSMKANAAICMLLSGLALACATELRVPRAIPIGLSLGAMAIAGLTLAEYAFGVDLGIDQLLFIDDAADAIPGRMAPTTAVCSVLIGAALLALLIGYVKTAHVLGALVLVLGLVALLGYLFGVSGLHTVSNYAAMAVPTALGLVALGVGVLCTWYERGLTGPFASKGVSGQLVRQFLPPAIGGPILVGWVLMQGERAGWYENRFSTSLAVVATVVLLGVLIWWAATALSRVDEQRATAEQDLRQLNLELEDRIEARTAELSESEERFRAVSESATDAVISSDAKGRIIYANTAAATLFGYTSDEIKDESLTVLMPERFRDAHRDGISRFVSTGVAKLVGAGSVELTGLHRSGQEIPIELSLSSWTAKSETFVTGIIRDITERTAAHRALEERETFFRALAENVSDLILRMRPDGTITYASSAARSVLGIAPDDLIGRTALDLFEPEGKVDVQRVFGNVLNGTSSSTQQAVRRADGTSVWVDAIASPTIDPATGVTSGVIWVIRDVSQHVADLEREREIAQREHELNQLKNEFVGIVAHDLKSPMTVIGGFADIMIQGWTEIGDDDKIDFLRRIRENISRLSTLVDDVLQVSRIESGDIPLEPRSIDLGAFVRRTVEEIAGAHPDRSVNISIDPDLPTVRADTDRLWRVVSNLMSNALKFSDAPAAVDVVVGGRGPSHLMVTIRDHGHGIEAAEMDKLFGRFSRLSQPGGHNVKGTGLGLYISKQLVEAQGGEIWAESTVGEGTTFSFAIPVDGDDR